MNDSFNIYTPPRKSSTGGTITATERGMIHQSGRNYSSIHAQAEKREPVPKSRNKSIEIFDPEDD